MSVRQENGLVIHPHGTIFPERNGIERLAPPWFALCLESLLPCPGDGNQFGRRNAATVFLPQRGVAGPSRRSPSVDAVPLENQNRQHGEQDVEPHEPFVPSCSEGCFHNVFTVIPLPRSSQRLWRPDGPAGQEKRRPNGNPDSERQHQKQRNCVGRRRSGRVCSRTDHPPRNRDDRCCHQLDQDNDSKPSGPRQGQRPRPCSFDASENAGNGRSDRKTFQHAVKAR